VGTVHHDETNEVRVIGRAAFVFLWISFHCRFSSFFVISEIILTGEKKSRRPTEHRRRLSRLVHVTDGFEHQVVCVNLPVSHIPLWLPCSFRLIFNRLTNWICLAPPKLLTSISERFTDVFKWHYWRIGIFEGNKYFNRLVTHGDVLKFNSNFIGFWMNELVELVSGETCQFCKYCR